MSPLCNGANGGFFSLDSNFYLYKLCCSHLHTFMDQDTSPDLQNQVDL